jgi:hypothetical protein
MIGRAGEEECGQRFSSIGFKELDERAWGRGCLRTISSGNLASRPRLYSAGQMIEVTACEPAF